MCVSVCVWFVTAHLSLSIHSLLLRGDSNNGGTAQHANKESGA